MNKLIQRNVIRYHDFLKLITGLNHPRCITSQVYQDEDNCIEDGQKKTSAGHHKATFKTLLLFKRIGRKLDLILSEQGCSTGLKTSTKTFISRQALEYYNAAIQQCTQIARKMVRKGCSTKYDMPSIVPGVVGVSKHFETDKKATSKTALFPRQVQPRKDSPVEKPILVIYPLKYVSAASCTPKAKNPNWLDKNQQQQIPRRKINISIREDRNKVVLRQHCKDWNRKNNMLMSDKVKDKTEKKKIEPEKKKPIKDIGSPTAEKGAPNESIISEDNSSYVEERIKTPRYRVKLDSETILEDIDGVTPKDPHLPHKDLLVSSNALKPCKHILDSYEDFQADGEQVITAQNVKELIDNKLMLLSRDN